jgi:hypothetical protein
LQDGAIYLFQAGGLQLLEVAELAAPFKKP